MKKLAPFLVILAGCLWGTMGIFVRHLNAIGLEAMEIVSCMSIPAPLKNLKNKQPRFERVIDKEAMKQEVLDWLK